MGSSPSAIICFGIPMPDQISELYEDWQAGDDDFATEHLPTGLIVVEWGYGEEPEHYIAAEGTYQENDWEQAATIDPEMFQVSYGHLFKGFEASPEWVLLALGKS